MTVLVVEAVWLNETERCSVDELARRSGLSAAEITELAQAGALAALDANTFQASSVTLARRARRLRDDFELDTDALCVAVRLLQRILDLEQRLDDLQVHRQRH